MTQFDCLPDDYMRTQSHVIMCAVQVRVPVVTALRCHSVPARTPAPTYTRQPAALVSSEHGVDPAPVHFASAPSRPATSAAALP